MNCLELSADRRSGAVVSDADDRVRVPEAVELALAAGMGRDP